MKPAVGDIGLRRLHVHMDPNHFKDLSERVTPVIVQRNTITASSSSRTINQQKGPVVIR